MVNVCLGVISKASPSLNIFAVGFPALIPIGLVLVTFNPKLLLQQIGTVVVRRLSLFTNLAICQVIAMAEEQDQDDKTEDPTARRMEKAREDGQVLRSQDASTAAVTLGVIATLYYGGFWFAPKLVELFKSALILEPGLVLRPTRVWCASVHCSRKAFSS